MPQASFLQTIVMFQETIHCANVLQRNVHVHVHHIFFSFNMTIVVQVFVVYIVI